MRICIFGAGAIGGAIAAQLGLAGHQVSLVARGDHLAAIRDRGLRLETPEGAHVLWLPASDRPEELGVQDAVLTAVKAHALPGAAAGIRRLLHGETCVVYAMNGIPWWYFHGDGGRFDGRRIELLDPAGALWDDVGVDRALGCVVNFMSATPAPGVARRTGTNNRLLLGEPDGSRSDRLRAVAGALADAGFEVVADVPIRKAIWTKLRRGAVSSALATLISAPSGDALRVGELLPVFRRAATEIGAVAAALGYPLDGDLDAIIAQGRASTHRPSMLQDLDRGRPMEIDAQLTVPQQLARMAGVATPAVDLLSALVRARARAAGLYGVSGKA